MCAQYSTVLCVQYVQSCTWPRVGYVASPNSYVKKSNEKPGKLTTASTPAPPAPGLQHPVSGEAAWSLPTGGGGTGVWQCEWEWAAGRLGRRPPARCALQRSLQYWGGFFERHRRRCYTPTQQGGQWVRPAHPSASACPSTANNHRRPAVGAHPPRQQHEGRSFLAGKAARPPGRPPACPPTCPSVRPADRPPGRPAACPGQGAPRRWHGAPTEGGGGMEPRQRAAVVVAALACAPHDNAS